MAEESRGPGKWFLDSAGDHRAKARLFCLPYGGGGASFFSSWRRYLPAEIELCPVQLPGRENRATEESHTSVLSLVEAIAEHLTPYLELPFSIFGHSLGALLGFELAREARRRFAIEPVWLGVSGYPAPHLPHRRPKVSHLPQNAFWDVLKVEYATDEALLQDQEMRNLIYPTLRADFEAVESYCYLEEMPLSCNLTAFGGTEDLEANRTELEAWSAQTRGRFSLQMFSGGHSFLWTSSKQIAELTTMELLRRA